MGGETWRRIEDIHEPFLYRFSSITAMNGKLYVGAARYDRSNGEYVGGIFQLDEQNNALIEIKTDRDMNAITSLHIVRTTFYVGTTHGQGVFLWNEGWDSWQNIGLVDRGIDIMEITVSESNVYVRTQHGKIYILKNHEEPWELNKEANVHRRFAHAIKIDNKHYNLSKREGLILSVDDGNSWTKLNDGIEHEQISTVEIDGTDFYIGTTQNEIYKWNHKDEIWVKLGSLSLPVQSLAVKDGFLYAGTGAGVHRIQITTETVSVDIK